LIATRVPLARWTAATTRPDAPAPSSRSGANPGTTHELIHTGDRPDQRDTGAARHYEILGIYRGSKRVERMGVMAP
jgi:hypothetical protein